MRQIAGAFAQLERLAWSPSSATRESVRRRGPPKPLRRASPKSGLRRALPPLPGSTRMLLAGVAQYAAGGRAHELDEYSVMTGKGSLSFELSSLRRSQRASFRETQ